MDDEVRAAEVLYDVIEPTLAPHAAVSASEIERYWKVPEWLEVSLDLEPLYEPQAVCDRLLALADRGWTLADDPPARDAVWNPAPGSLFLAPEVRWAHLHLWFEDPAT